MLRHHFVAVRHAQNFAQIAAVRTLRAHRVQVIQVAKNIAVAGVFGLAQQDVGRLHINAQYVGEMLRAVECDQIMIRRHQRELGEVFERIARLHRHHQRLNATDHFSEARAVACFEQARQIFLKKRGVLLVA